MGDNFNLSMVFEFNIDHARDAGECYYVIPSSSENPDCVWRINKADKSVEYLSTMTYILEVPNKETFISIDPSELKKILNYKEEA